MQNTQKFTLDLKLSVTTVTVHSFV